MPERLERRGGVGTGCSPNITNDERNEPNVRLIKGRTRQAGDVYIDVRALTRSSMRGIFVSPAHSPWQQGFCSQVIHKREITTPQCRRHAWYTSLHVRPLLGMFRCDLKKSTTFFDNRIGNIVFLDFGMFRHVSKSDIQISLLLLLSSLQLLISEVKS